MSTSPPIPPADRATPAAGGPGRPGAGGPGGDGPGGPIGDGTGHPGGDRPGDPSVAGRPLPAALTRGREGRWLAGVCVGLARHRGLPLRSVRAAFAVTAFVGGVGVLAYLACWLIIPAEGDEQTGTAGLRGIVVLAQACAACAGLATLAAAGGAATIFGFGWVVLVIAAVVLVGALASWPRVGAGWTLLPVAAVILPALSMTVGGVRISPEIHDVAVAPQSVATVPAGGYKSGLGSLLVDLRHTTFPAKGDVAVQIDAGIRRTIVALPADRCVYVELDYDVVPFAARVASVLSGRVTPFSGVTLFGELQGSRTGEDAGNAPSPSPGGPVLHIYFHSAGGSLYVRDYPDDVNPPTEPDWPGYPVTLEPRPDTTGTPRVAARRLIDSWLLRRRVQSASAAAINRVMPGPCGASGAQPVEGQLAKAIPAGQDGKPEAPSYDPETGGAYDPEGGVPAAPSVPAAPAAPAAPYGRGTSAGSGGTAPESGGAAGGSAGTQASGSAGTQASGSAGTQASGSAGTQASGPARGRATGAGGKTGTRAAGKTATPSAGKTGTRAGGEAPGARAGGKTTRRTARQTAKRAAGKSAARSTGTAATQPASDGSRR
jgi:phage shock protein PspC (stress-responsive transcriptional regulator)